MGAFAEIGVRLIERGYAAVPIMPGTKEPGVLRKNGKWVHLPRWQERYQRRQPSEIELACWSRGDAGVGVVGGHGGMVAFDIDTDDPAIRAALDVILPKSSVRKIGRRGETLFYYAPKIANSKRWLINGKVVLELIGPGRQTVLPPTIHPDTQQPYRWSGIEGLDALKPCELPKLPDDIVAQITTALTVFGCAVDDTPPVGRSNGDGEDTPHRQLNDAAMANFAAWVPTLPLHRLRHTRAGYEAAPTWRPSSSGKSDDERDLNLKIHPKGIKDFGADKGYTPLDLVMTALGCDLDEAFSFLADKLDWFNGATIELHIDTVQPTPETEPPPDPDPLISYATNLPGVVGDIVDYVTATARRPNRVLALCTAVTVIGTLIGRRVASPTRSATHLYVVGVAPTGNGKQHILNSAGRLLRAAGASDHIGPSKFFSQSAMVDMLEYKPLALCPQDEIGVFLKAITSRRASSHEAATSSILRNAWGLNFEPLYTPAWATRRTSQINCPAISILGVSTPDEFYSALQGDSINNGFLNRFLVLQSNVRVMDTTPIDPAVPDRLREALKALYIWSGPQSLLQINDPKIAYPPDILPWANDAAYAVYEDLSKTVDRKIDEQPIFEPYIARCGEIAVRLATIRAAGRWGPGAAVDASDMNWAGELAWKAGQAMMDAVVDQVPQTDRGEFADKLLAIIRRRRTVKTRDIQRAMHARVRSAEIKDILHQLVEAGLIKRIAEGEYRATE